MAFDAHPCENKWAPFATSVTTTIIAAILIIITVPGNLLICWAVIWNPKRNLKSPFNYLVLNLAIADLSVGAVTEPVFVGFHMIEALQHQNAQEAKWVVNVSYLMSSTASLLSIIALAVNRYQLATQNRIKQSKRSTVMASSAIVWISSLGISLLYLTVEFYILAFAFVNTAVIISTGVLAFAYFRIYYNLRRHSKNTEHIRSSGDQAKNAKQEEKITISFLLIILSFLTCAIPCLVMIYIITLCGTCSCVLIHWLRDFQYLFLLGNSASNQFLYAWRMRSFQSAFQVIPFIRWGIRRFGSKRVFPVLGVETHQEIDRNPAGNNKGVSTARCRETEAGIDSHTGSAVLSFCDRGTMRKERSNNPTVCANRRMEQAEEKEG